ncbi:inositol 5-phosphatase [Holotrichia oblita]|uniref:Inositol 5-phosphatase n=2 Tax=Holotrichia oblita TaxID=644536 RepID=A0ACB9TV41_HOLOL|nr:inositol 5-phosphatase [Holotrichia oblita]KAI4470639.1 inositol 5-phosphatase [Holotrichia oblita]
MENLRLYVVTYNVGTSTPEQNLNSLLSLPDSKHDKNLPDFYVVALQEVKAQPHNLLASALFDDPWTNECKEVLAKRSYVKLKTIRLQGLILSTFCLRKHLLNIRDVEADYTRTGLSGMWGNKGAVSIRLSIYGCSICFVNSHLSAHDHMLKARIDDYDSILKDQHFHVDAHSEIFFHDYVFWMGDLNFRLLEELEMSLEEIVARVKKGEYQKLFEYDQLRYVMKKGDAFTELQEGDITFAPTFKFEVESSFYDCKRRPAWTDRILYKVNPNNYDNIKLKIQQNSYKSHPEYSLSDHKPVTSDFTIKMVRSKIVTDSTARGVKVFADYAEEVVQFKDIEFWWAEEDNCVTYSITKEITKTKEDWIGVFKNNFISLDDYIIYEYVYKNASPVVLPKQASHSRSTVQPTEYTVRFSELDFKGKDELYQLVYFSETEDKVQSVLGISKPFALREKRTNSAID